ncbi:TetR/AcrR family transcriptional regulator [Sulfurospirillum barnesii]|uniref:Transcriptional regulator n=1 Tax=Sulfurospirillum barnesii (strain ATCC 700032 / DSM 10660 / SES-3) TaxID=760154 RepID=I3XWS1_SULBS|nr:TetR/AcrR family transcriptional regulator [Sulfurospirillum barnesii]AFL68395.1 transcriptional regulator [Sulfurospirillum barnesii SES-3]
MEKQTCIMTHLCKRRSDKAASRCTKIVDVAHRLFLDKGYENVSMQDIVKVSGGSLATLYKHFGNKSQLLIYVLEQKSEELFGEWGRQSSHYEGRLEAFLQMIATSYLDLLIKEDAILFNRLVASLGYLEETKSLNQTILEVMMRPVYMVAEYLEKEKERGRVEVEDTMLCAHQFLSSLEEPFMFPRILGVSTDISEQRCKQAIHQIVKIFCSGLRPAH